MIKKYSVWIGVLVVLAVGVQMGCRIGSADSTARQVGVNIAGVYHPSSGSRLISQHSGAAITHMNVIQDGSRLQGVCNHGEIFRGSIGSVTDGGANARSASFSLRGRTTSGEEGVISGSFSVSGTDSYMRGTWAEPTQFGSVEGRATVSGPSPTPQPTNNTSTNATARL